jgi:hypothetical protein
MFFHTSRKKSNNILIFFPTNIIPIYISKEPKLTKWGQQKNKPIKCSYMKKEITSKSLRKNKALIYSTIIELTFQMAFLHWSIHDKKKRVILYYSKCYFINLPL